MSRFDCFVFASLVLATVGLCGCGSTMEPVPTVELIDPPAPGEGLQFAVDTIVPPYSEVWMCSVYPIPTEAVANVHSVEYQQNPGMHHMTISTTGFDAPPIDYGMVECEALYAEFMDGLTMIFGSQGASHDTMTLPDGVAASLPASLDIVHEVHYVNTTAEPVALYSRVNAYTIPTEDVGDRIWGGQVRDENLFLPPNAEHTEWTRCVFNRDVEVLFLASHTHDLGIEFTVAPFDGTQVGDVLYRNTDLHDPMIVQYESPLVIPQGQGFEYSCTWSNTRDHEVIYGLSATDEMCNLAIVHTPFDMSARCEVTETSDGVLWHD